MALKQVFKSREREGGAEGRQNAWRWRDNDLFGACILFYNLNKSTVVIPWQTSAIICLSSLFSSFSSFLSIPHFSLSFYLPLLCPVLSLFLHLPFSLPVFPFFISLWTAGVIVIWTRLFINATPPHTLPLPPLADLVFDKHLTAEAWGWKLVKNRLYLIPRGNNSSRYRHLLIFNLDGC